MVDVARLAIEVDASQAVVASKQLQTLQGSAGKTEVATKKAAGSFRMAGNGVQMMGYQVQDIAVQLGMGTSPFIVLAQQGSQIASIFGPGGAALGAILAISGAVAGPLVSSLMRSAETTDKMSEAIRTLREEMNAITEQQTITALESETAKLQKGLSMLASPIRDVRSEGEDLLETVTGVSAGFLSNSELIVAAQVRLRENNSLIERQKGLIEEVNQERMQEFGPEASLFYQARWDAERKLAAESLAADEMRLQSRADTLKQIESLELSQLSANERLTDTYLEQQYAINDALSQGVISTEEANALKYQSDLEYAEKKQQLDAQVIQAQMAANDAFLSAAQNLNNNLLAALEAYGADSTKLGAAAIVAQKGMMFVQAIMAAELSAIQTQAAYAALAAATANPALIGVGATHAGVVRGMGYASAALIAATEFQPSFLGGGYTGSGSRTGGVDGMGGFNAVLHPNEAVFDLTRGTGMAVADGGGDRQTVVNNYGAADGYQVRTEQIGAKEVITIMKATFANDMARGGSMYRALSGATRTRRAAR